MEAAFTTMSQEFNMDTAHSVYISDVESLCEVGKELQQYEGYCRTLNDFVSAHQEMRIDGMPVPMYILRNFAYSQERIANIKSLEMRKFVSIIADTACLTGVLPIKRGVIEAKIRKTVAIFNEDIVAYLNRANILLTKTIRGHIKEIDQLQKQQQKCWNLDKNVQKWQKVLETIQKKYSRNAKAALPRNIRTKLDRLTNDIWGVRDELVENQIVFCEMVENELKARTELIQISDAIKTKVGTVLKDRIKQCLGTIRNIFETTYLNKKARFHGKHAPVVDLLEGISLDTILEDIMRLSSKTYVFPNTEAYNIYMKDMPKLPSGKINEKVPSRNVKPNMETVVGGSVHLSKNLNGFHLKISGRMDAPSPAPGFFEMKSDLHVKCKLGLLKGSVGFGWTRKSNFNSQKNWNFFVRPPTLADVMGDATSGTASKRNGPICLKPGLSIAIATNREHETGLTDDTANGVEQKTEHGHQVTKDTTSAGSDYNAMVSSPRG